MGGRLKKPQIWIFLFTLKAQLSRSSGGLHWAASVPKRLEVNLWREKEERGKQVSGLPAV